MKTELEKIKAQLTASGNRQSIQRIKEDQQRERARKKDDQELERLNQLAENSGLLPAIRDAVHELGWKNCQITRDYERNDKYPYNPTALKIGISPHSSDLEHHGSVELTMRANGNVWSHLDDQIFPLIKVTWERNPGAIEKLVARAFLNPKHESTQITGVSG